MLRALAIVLTALLALSGCAATPAPRSRALAEPLGVQVRRADPSMVAPFVVLLGFEGETDRVFQSGGTIARGGKAIAHTGDASLAVRDRVAVHLAALTSGGAFPGDWTLAGAYVYADAPAVVEITCGTTGNSARAVTNRVAVPGGRWSAAHVDITSLPIGAPAELRFRFTGPVRFIDDIVLINDARPLLEASAWSVHHRGHRTIARWPGGVERAWPTTDDGASDRRYTVTEAAPARLHLTAEAGDGVFAYPDGRCFDAGQCVAMPVGLTAAQREAFAAQHTSPGQLDVPTALGEVNRVSTGDADNDGYNERSGTYRVTARGPRLDVTITAGRHPLVHPLLEIANLPSGEARATIEGKWLPVFGRTRDGNLLVAVPTTVERPTVVSIRVN